MWKLWLYDMCIYKTEEANLDFQGLLLPMLSDKWYASSEIVHKKNKIVWYVAE